MRVLPSALASFSLMLGVLPLAAQEEKSTAELRAMSDEKAARQARRDLNSLLADFSGYTVGNRLALGDVWFFTDPRATGVAGLCERDLVQLFYHTTERRPRDWATAKVRPYKIEAQRMYSFLKVPGDTSIAEYRAQEDGPLPWSRNCRANTKKEWTGWFFADDEFQAVQGYRVLVAAHAAVVVGSVKVTGCEEYEEDGVARCLASLTGALDPQMISKIKRINYGDEPMKFLIDGNSTWITIELDVTHADPKAEHIKSVKVSEYIVVT